MKRTALLVILVSFLTASAFSQADLQPAAIVNLIRSEPITVKQLRTEIERFEKSLGRKLTESDRRGVLDSMINERLAIQAAERDRITVTENELNQQMEQLRRSMAQQIGRQPTDAEFNQAIREQNGMDMPAFREQMRRQMITQKYLMAKKENLFNSIKTPTEQEILSRYNIAKAQLVRPDTVRFSMIQVAYGNDAASRTKARELANRLSQEIGSNPSKFDEVAARGQTPNSGYQAGDAGYLPRNSEALTVVGQDFLDIAFSLKQGEVSRVIEGRVGYQIIKITENYAMKNLELDDIGQLGTRITVRDYIGQMILNEKQQAVLKQATEELVTELRRGNPFQVFEQNLKW